MQGAYSSLVVSGNALAFEGIWRRLSLAEDLGRDGG
jgi:hypothetical protein